MSINTFLTLSSMTLAYGEPTATSSPNLKFFDWKRTLSSIPVSNPMCESLVLQSGQEVTIFDGSRTTTEDGTTAFALTLSPLDPSAYRFTKSAGTDPTLRTPRTLALNTVALTLAIASNSVMTVTAVSTTPFGSVQVGDIFFVPGPSTGDTTAGFNPINEGQWLVLGASSSVLSLVRLQGQEFQGISESVTVSSTGVLAYSAAGVQVGDKVEISAGFSSNVLRTYEVVAVTSKWFGVTSTIPLVNETAIPGAAGLAFYTASKRFVRVEADQEVVVRVNGDTGTFNRVAPWVPGDSTQRGEFVKSGPTWSLKVFNRSSVPTQVTVITAE